MPKKILLYTRPIIPPWDEASKNLSWEIAKNSSDEFQFEVLTTKQNGSDVEGIAGGEKNEKRKKAERFQDFLNENNKEKIIPRPIFSSANFGKREKIQLLKFLYSLGKQRFDIIHFPFSSRPLTSALIKRKIKNINAKTVQTIATLQDKYYKNKNKLKKIFFADVIVAQSDYTFKKLKKAGIGNLELIYPAIDLHKFHVGEKDDKLMKKFVIAPDDFVILFPGEYVRLKAIDDIISAFKIITGENSLSDSNKLQAMHYKLLLACRIKSKKDAIKRNKIKRQIKKTGLEKNIVFIETFADMSKLYNLSDLIIFPVREMTGKFDIPLTLVEAMACKKPVLVSDIPVLKEFIKENQNGFVIPKSQPEKLAKKIDEIAQNPELAKKVAREGFEFALANFDISKNVKKYEEIYRRL